MLRKIRITLATLFFIGVTLLFLDFTGTVHAWLGWMARVQFLPAVLALNVAVVAALVVLTLVFGRVYCSVICPLGVLQDIFGWSGWRGKKAKYRFTYKPARQLVRGIVLALFVVLMAAGLGSVASLIAPYSAFGRIASTIFAPVWALGNNLLAWFAEYYSSYAFYEKEVWMKGGITLAVAVLTFAVLLVVAARSGRAYCNTVCPVGTVLGFLARFSWLKPVIDTSKCNGCGLCARGCKASCIDPKAHKIDYTRCVACMDCLGNCRQGAISYRHPSKAAAAETPAKGGTPDESRRGFLAGVAAVVAAGTVKAQKMKTDGALAVILDKKAPERSTPVVPPGALSIKHLTDHCTACQLCVSVCPNDVLRPSADLSRLMKPESSFERGYCRPECVKCSEVCPTKAITPITVEEKTAIQTGHAVWIKENCVALTDNVDCGNWRATALRAPSRWCRPTPPTPPRAPSRWSTPTSASAAEPAKTSARRAPTAPST